MAKARGRRVVSIEQRVEIPATPQAVYDALIDSAKHSEFTGGGASIEPHVGGKMSAWDGYIWGEFIELDPPKRIVQSWRTTEWPDGFDDSRLEFTMEPISAGTRLTMIHTNVPASQAPDYEMGWTEHYWEPLKAYVERK